MPASLRVGEEPGFLQEELMQDFEPDSKLDPGWKSVLGSDPDLGSELVERSPKWLGPRSSDRPDGASHPSSFSRIWLAFQDPPGKAWFTEYYVVDLHITDLCCFPNFLSGKDELHSK